MTTQDRQRTLWLRGAGIALLGATLFYGGFALLLGHGPPGVILTVLWCVPVSATLAGLSFFSARKLFFRWGRMFLFTWVTALLLATALRQLHGS